MNEIDLAGNVLHLTTSKPVLLSVPAADKKDATAASASQPEASAENSAPQEPKSAQSAFEELMLSEAGKIEDLAPLFEFAKKVESMLADESEEGKLALKALPKEDIHIVYGEKSKAWRGSFHQLIREHYPKLRSETVTKPAEPASMRVWYGVDKYDKARARAAQPGRFLRLLLQKENKDTAEGVQLIARLFGLKPGQVQFAGTKDKRGVTTQALTIPYVEPSRAAGVNNKLIGITKIGNFSAVNSRLDLGDLQGNQFKVILRDLKLMPNAPFPGKQESAMEVESTEATVEQTIQAITEACEKFAESGFINYYGTQRFGTGTVRTHEVGVECLKGNWKQVVDLIMAPRGGSNTERPDSVRARELYAEGKFTEAFKIVPRFMNNERNLLQALSEGNKNDYKSAFERLPRPMRLMYPHAYQSYIWNKAASKRIERYGYQVVVGDLVVADISSLRQRNTEEDTDATPAPEGNAAEGKDASETKNGGTSASLSANIIVVQSEEEAKKYTMSNVVIPLPGPNSMLPLNDIGTFIREWLAKDGLSTAFATDKVFHLSGDYRPLITRPIDFEFHVLRYNLTEAELQQNEHPAYLEEFKREPKKLDIVEDGALVALQLVFSLQSSCYASCLVRELVKQPFDQAFLRDTKSAASQASESSSSAPSS